MSAAPLPEGEVHVWWCDLEGSAAREYDAWERLLDPSERDRAGNFRFPEDRRRWTAARGALRALAARYLDASPREIRFEHAPGGKPLLRDTPLRFNLSKSGKGVLIVFAAGREVGTDLERVRIGYDGADIAGRFLAPGEVASLAALPEGIRSEAFFRCWTAKEAYLKGRGDGLGFPLDAFEVSVEADEPRRLRRHRDPAEIHRWWLVPMTPADGYVATLAAEGELPAVRRFEAGRS